MNGWRANALSAALWNSRTLRFHLARLVCVAVIPLLIFTIIVAALFEKQQRASLERSFRDTVRALTVAVDHELTSSISVLQALATSEHLETGDLRLFYRAAQRMLATHPGWITINLTDLSGQQLVNIYKPFGARLPPIGHLEDVRHTLDTGEPSISNLFTGLVLRVPAVGFTVPVRRRGMLRYVLGAQLDVKILSLLLWEGKLPSDWVAAITDRNGIIIARTRGIETFLGKPTTPELFARSRRSDEGSFRDVTRDGTPVFGAYSRSRASGWTVALGVPVAVVEAPGRTFRWAIVSVGSLFLLLAGAFATVFGRRITGGIESLSASARALGQGQMPSPTERSEIAEIAAVEKEMLDAARQRADAVAGRLKSEEALRESEERTRLIVSHALDAVVTIDANGRITSWNPHAERLFGWPEEEIRGRLLSETIIPLAYREAHERGLRHFLATGEGPVLNRRIELSALHRNGTEFPVELAITPLQVAGAIVFSAFLRDLTEQKRTEKALRESEASFRLLCANNPLPMWVYDVATMAFLEVNDAAVAHYGYSREEFLGMCITDIRPPEDVPQLKDLVKHITEEEVQGVRRHHGQWRHRLKDGRLRDMDIVSHSLEFSGRPAALVVAIDVTEVKQSQEALANYAERLSILHDIDQAIIAGHPPAEVAETVVRRLRPLLGVPRAIVNIFDLEAGEVEWLAAAGRHRVRVGPGVRYSLQMAGDLEALKRGDPQVIDVDALPSSPEAEALLASGVHMYMVVPMIAGGELIGGLSFGGEIRHFAPEQISIAKEAATQLAIAITQARLSERVARHAEELELRVRERTHELSVVNEKLEQEISERRRAEAEADRANQAKSEFLSRMSHELRTPLNSVIGFAQVLEVEAHEPREREGLQYILKAGRHLLSLINEVLDIARIDAGKLTLSLEPVLVDDVVPATVDLIRPQAAARSIEILGAAPTNFYVLADRQRLQQVLLNLLSNAVKYNREGGTVSVACESSPPGRVRFAVTDTGNGIAAEMLDRLFRPFERLGAEGSGIEGTGLGLALSQRLVEAMGGTIVVKSMAGQGTTFTVELQCADGAPGTKEVLQSAEPADSRTDVRGTVLYIEDNLSNLRLVEWILARRPGVRLLSAMQGALGLELARDHRPDLIILDLHLPDLPGTEVLSRLLADATLRTVPVVILSADASPTQLSRLIGQGARGYLTKPLDVKQFLALVDELLQAVKE
jgi:PAS domain S-box-containing protein